MKPVLLTGFEPFGSDRDNPSQGIVERLDGCSIGGISVIGRVLPCVFYQAPRVLEAHILEQSPGLRMEDLVRGIQLAIATCLESRLD